MVFTFLMSQGCSTSFFTKDINIVDVQLSTVTETLQFGYLVVIDISSDSVSNAASTNRAHTATQQTTHG